MFKQNEKLLFTVIFLMTIVTYSQEEKQEIIDTITDEKQNGNKECN